MKRSKFTEEQIVRILQEAASGQKTQAQVCKDHHANHCVFAMGSANQIHRQNGPANITRRTTPTDPGEQLASCEQERTATLFLNPSLVDKLRSPAGTNTAADPNEMFCETTL